MLDLWYLVHPPPDDFAPRRLHHARLLLRQPRHQIELLRDLLGRVRLNQTVNYIFSEASLHQCKRKCQRLDLVCLELDMSLSSLLAS